ncbi:hypothetical protein PoB_004935400, partial [Plakobranchus ocellatus]
QDLTTVYKKIETKNMIEGFASFYIETPTPERLTVKRYKSRSGSVCDKEKWCENRFFWRPHPLNPLSSISVTIDTSNNEDMLKASVGHLTNGTMYLYELSVSTSQYSMGLTKCADLLLFREIHNLPWDSSYRPETANFFVLPPGRKISVNTCDMSLKGENMAYWTSQSGESIRLWHDMSSVISSSTASTLMITFDNQKSMMGVYYMLIKTLDWRKTPRTIVLREMLEVEKDIKKFKIPAPRTLNRDYVMYVFKNNASSDIGCRCNQKTICTNGMDCTVAHQEGKDVFIVEINVKLVDRLSLQFPLKKDYLEWRVSFVDAKFAGKIKKYYRLLFFPKGVHRNAKYVLLRETVSARKMSYVIKVRWFAYYLLIFPSLDEAGIGCKMRKWCDGRFYFEIVYVAGRPPVVLLDVHNDKSDNLNNYTVFVTDMNVMKFDIYRLSSPPAAAPRSTDPTVDRPPDLTVALPTDLTVARPSDPTMALPSNLTVDTLDSTDNIFSKNSAIVLLALVSGACFLAFVTVLTVHIMRSRKIRSSRETDQQAASETSEQGPSDGYEVLPGERISGDYEHIVEDRLSHGYESILNEDFPRNRFRNRKVSSSSHYQTISLENMDTSPQGASGLSQKDEALLKFSKSCGNLADSKVHIFGHADDKKEPVVQEPEPFGSTFSIQNSEEEQQPRLAWFMLKASSDDGPFAGAFYFTEVENSIELKDFSKKGRCSADADGECEYLTALDSSREHEDYLELIAD